MTASTISSRIWLALWCDLHTCRDFLPCFTSTSCIGSTTRSNACESDSHALFTPSHLTKWLENTSDHETETCRDSSVTTNSFTDCAQNARHPPEPSRCKSLDFAARCAQVQVILSAPFHVQRIVPERYQRTKEMTPAQENATSVRILSASNSSPLQLGIHFAMYVNHLVNKLHIR